MNLMLNWYHIYVIINKVHSINNILMRDVRADESCNSDGDLLCDAG